LGLAIDFASAELVFPEPALCLLEGCERIDMLDDISQLIPFYDMWLLAELLEVGPLLDCSATAGAFPCGRHGRPHAGPHDGGAHTRGGGPRAKAAAR
jgi:hypothetical protein